eukprot:TRINITY_DN30189_c0_g1_i1.p1 TRINITY_DN30189_c0_g1~~TRINITY_DN30189_c0_g1_i1.p1  ORF type:complete len:632 (+),score=171.78 TRINITY_DN30189_c0_g1_i1:72-1967(+)
MAAPAGAREGDSWMGFCRRIVQRPAIPLDDVHTGPLDKFYNYGRLPMKMTLNLLIVVLLMVELLVWVPTDNKFYNNSVLSLSYYFTPTGQVGVNPTLTYTFYDVNDIRDFMVRSHLHWWQLDQNPVGLFYHAEGEDGRAEYPTMSFSQKVEGTYSGEIGKLTPDVRAKTITCTLTRDNPAGPFGIPDPERDYTHIPPECVPQRAAENEFGKVSAIDITYNFNSVRVQGPAETTIAYEWEIKQEFLMSSHNGAVEFSLSYEMAKLGIPESQVGDTFWHPYCFLGLVCLLCAVWDLCLRIKAIHKEKRMGATLPVVRGVLEEDKQNEAAAAAAAAVAAAAADARPSGQRSHLAVQNSFAGSRQSHTTNTTNSSMVYDEAAEYGVAEDLRETDSREPWWTISDHRFQWLVVGSVADCFVITSRALHLWVCTATSSVPWAVLITRSTFNGIGVLLVWVVVLSHLENQPRFYLLIKTLFRGTPKAFRFIAGCFPIMVGYATMGTVVFGGYTDSFSTLDGSFVTLFCVMNGDMIDDTFAATFFEGSLYLMVFSRLYIYSYIALFIYAILNILLAILEDAYFQVKRQLIEGLREEESVSSDSDDDALANNSPTNLNTTVPMHTRQATVPAQVPRQEPK